MTKRLCQTCSYWDREADSDRGLCRRNPPAGYGDGDRPIGEWPVTGIADWCGGHTYPGECGQFFHEADRP